MFGVIQGGIGGTGIAAPFANPPSQPSVPGISKSRSNARPSKAKQPTLGGFRDDTRLVALRYDQTVALEPPIPLPPPRSPLRLRARASSFDLPPNSIRSAPMMPPPLAPPPRPAPPTEQHPALRTISTQQNPSNDLRRDSVLASTASLSSRSQVSYAHPYDQGDSSDEDDDPFAYERIDAITSVRPLQLRTESINSSVYSLHDHEDSSFDPVQKRVRVLQSESESEIAKERERERERERAENLKRAIEAERAIYGERELERQLERGLEREREGSRQSERVSEADSRPSDASLSPALSIGSTASPTLPSSPATPPPHFSKRFIRSLSFRSNSNSNKLSSPPSSMKRLRKKSPSTEDGSGSVSGSSQDQGGIIDKDKDKDKHGKKRDGDGNGNGNGSRRVETISTINGSIRSRSSSSVSSNMATGMGMTGIGSVADTHMTTTDSKRTLNRANTSAGTSTTSTTTSTNTSRTHFTRAHANSNASANAMVPSPSSLLSSTPLAGPLGPLGPSDPSSPLPTSAGAMPLSRSYAHSWRPTNPILPTNDPTNNNHANPAPTGPVHAGPVHAGPASASPTISTNIPCESFFEDDDLSKLSFSIRGSLIFGGKRPWKTSASANSANHKMAEKDVIPEVVNATSRKARVFPLVPTASKKDPVGPAPARPPREDDMGVAALIQRPFQLPESSHLHQHHHSKSDSANENRSTSHKVPPSIRVISAEAEKESQKVRSLYESGEALQLGDGDVSWPLGGTPELPPEVPSEVDGNDAPNPNAQLRGRHTRTSVSTSLPAPQGNHGLAGGIEDWEGVQGQDVDRYGFIVAHRSDTSSPPGSASGSSTVHFSSRKNRKVLGRKDATSLSLGAKRGPSKKMSARSLNTHTSELSALSRRSVRSTIRQAANRLPHNKDRRLIDEAGDLLALQPGLSYVHEVEGAEKIAADLRRKEGSRTEKWRKMAKVTKAGSEGQGTSFYFDAKNPKLIERTWKGIPDCWRSAAWFSFLESSAKADPIHYATNDELMASFRHLVGEPSPDDTQIDLDVPRTINQHIMFRKRYRGGQRLLFRVLHALSLYFPDTGYVQGMAPLAATLLSYYDEERCFIMLVRLWQFRGLNRIYQSGFVELIEALKDFETHWLNDKDVAEMLRELCIDPTAYATRWYLTLFNLSIPFPVQLRVWDVFMLLGSSPPDQPLGGQGTEGLPSSQGLEILHATSLAIIDTLHSSLIDSDFENAMKSLTSWVPIKDEQKFLEIVQIEWKKHQNRQKKKA